MVNQCSFPIDNHFDTAMADEMARLETFNKHHYRPNNYMHKWWARRCGSTFRLILKHLVTNPDRQDYYQPGGMEGKIVLDPMMGGGTTLHEAIRLGANVIGVDIDPIPVLQARATLSDVSLVDLEAAFAELMTSLQDTLGNLFITTCPTCTATGSLRYMLYGLRRNCACGPVILVDKLVLHYDGQEPAFRLCAYCGKVMKRGETCNCPADVRRAIIRNRQESVCPQCHRPYLEDLSCPYYARYEPLVVVGQCETHGHFYKKPAESDKFRIVKANDQRNTDTFGPPEHFRVPEGPKANDLTARGVTNFLDLFSSRQLLLLDQAIQLLPRFPAPIRLNLALLISTSLEFNSMLCGYKGARRGERSGAIRHAFSYHAFTFPYTAVENNYLFPQNASGTLLKLFHDRIRRARKWAAHPREKVVGPRSRFVSIPGEQDRGVEVEQANELLHGRQHFFLHQGSATDLPIGDNIVDFVVTDPPYFDSVQYSELAAFFRVWLQKLHPAGGNWQYDPAGSAVDPHANGTGQYTRILSGIFAECRRVLRPETGRLVFTFHHWNPQGWAALTIALQQAGFQLINRYVVQSENPVSVHIANVRSLKHDAILVLSPAGWANMPEWRRPEVINKQESDAFCYDCATMLGWLLTAKHSDSVIQLLWQDFLG